MISIEKACEIALKDFRSYWGEEMKIRQINENKNSWIITPLPPVDMFGPIPVSINKITGELLPYPTQQHFEEFRKSKKIKIPKDYR